MPAIALLVKESLSLLIKLVTTHRNMEYGKSKVKIKNNFVFLLHSSGGRQNIYWIPRCAVCGR